MTQEQEKQQVTDELDKIEAELKEARDKKLQELANLKKELAKEDEKRIARYRELYEKGIKLLEANNVIIRTFNDLIGIKELPPEHKKIYTDAIKAWNVLVKLNKEAEARRLKRQDSLAKARATKEAKKKKAEA